MLCLLYSCLPRLPPTNKLNSNKAAHALYRGREFEPVAHLSSELVVLHDVSTDEHACPAQASLAVDGQCTRSALSNAQKAEQDLLAGAGAIREVQLMVLEPSVQETLAVIHLENSAAAVVPTNKIRWLWGLLRAWGQQHLLAVDAISLMNDAAGHP